MKLKTQEHFRDFLTATLYGYAAKGTSLTNHTSLLDLGLDESDLTHLEMDLNDYFEGQIVDFNTQNKLTTLGLEAFVSVVYSNYESLKSSSSVEDALNQKLYKFVGKPNDDNTRNSILNAVLGFALDNLEFEDTTTDEQIANNVVNSKFNFLGHSIEVLVMPTLEPELGIKTFIK